MNTNYEVNIDGLVGPTHHYAGLALGNLASTTHAFELANPREAALQGLKKMAFLHRAGLKQALFPPHQRPNLHLLHQLGFKGNPQKQIEKAYQEAPRLLHIAFSASSMWTANMATVTPSQDSIDERLHFSPANLVSNLHRQQESEFSHHLLQTIFPNPRYFQHHSPLPSSSHMADEGAANHCRLSQNHGKPGLHLFAYGKAAFYADKAAKAAKAPQKYPARQSYEASQAIARRHELNEGNSVFACQNPQAIDEGVFHNDVIALSNQSLLILHECAFLNQKTICEELKAKANFPLKIIEIDSKSLSLKEAVKTYFFNSQLLSLDSQTMLLLSPQECQEEAKTRDLITKLIEDTTNPIAQVEYFDLRQSMKNGGGPACLRLRVPLNSEELAEMHQGVLLDEPLFSRLETWIQKHYRSELSFQDLRDPLFLDEVLTALDELTSLLKLGSIYPFQKEKTFFIHPLDTQA